MWADSLTEAEVEGTLYAADQLVSVSWAAPLLNRTKPILDRLLIGKGNRELYRENPLKPSEKSFLFEIRFAHSLAMAGVTAEYEYSTGEGNTTVDFKVNLDPPWLVELVSLHESEAFKKASWASDAWQGFMLSSDAIDPRESEEGEILKAQERIGSKLCDNKQRPIKFPVPRGAIHLLMVDARGYLGYGQGDNADWHQIAYGPLGLEDNLIRFWTNLKTGQRAPIRGLFEQNCPLLASRVVQQRLHAIGFVCERTFAAGEIKERSFYRCNPALFKNEEEALIVMSHWPLRRTIHDNLSS
jgi:hypothetical protein